MYTDGILFIRVYPWLNFEILTARRANFLRPGCNNSANSAPLRLCGEEMQRLSALRVEVDQTFGRAHDEEALLGIDAHDHLVHQGHQDLPFALQHHE